jgi:AICAR transformylase/IMP cyclohydrolase purH (only IMP cyclohydrolase domain in aful)
MKEFELKYGCNPNQKPAKVYMEDNSELPFEILNGRAGYINLLDALNAWQLVSELSKATGMPAATSFKHVSPTSAAIGRKLSTTLKKMYFVEDIAGLDESPLACAYARARGTDRMSSFGDFIALSDTCDEVTANLIKREVSDGVIAPDYSDEALEILKSKKKGNYCIIKINKDYMPKSLEKKQVFGVTFEQGRNEYRVDENTFKDIVSKNRDLDEEAILNLTIALIALKYTQSNSVCYAKDGQVIGVGAGQQSRIHCTRLAGNKADLWHLRGADKVLNLPFIEDIARATRDNVIDIYLSKDYEDVIGDKNWQQYFKFKPEIFTEKEREEFLSNVSEVALGSDAFFPFEDNIERAFKSGVKYVAESGGAIRDKDIIETADKYNMVLCFTHARLFHH